ncbi:MAG: DUF4332 domain-containing protein, partial [Chloroflexota bacterium]|nr:DUF4332 domain-containing protein [Chloroflexota bacterium]
MGNFRKGLLVGIGLGLLMAPMRGQEMRHLVGERVQKLRGYLPDDAQLNQYVPQISDRVTQTASTLKGSTEQVASQVKNTVGNLSNSAPQASSNVKQMAKDVASTTRQGAVQTQQSAQPTTSSTVLSSEDTGSTGGNPALGNPLSMIPGMEPEPQNRLGAEGIYTTQQLLQQTSTKEERADLAQKIGMSTNMLRTLVDRADLMRLQGVGGDVATLLEEAGVNGCKDLQQRNPEHLHATLTKAQENSKIVSRTPGLEQITEW